MFRIPCQDVSPEEAIDWCMPIFLSCNGRALFADVAVFISVLASPAMAQSIAPQDGAVRCFSPVAPSESCLVQMSVSGWLGRCFI